VKRYEAKLDAQKYNFAAGEKSYLVFFQEE